MNDRYEQTYHLSKECDAPRPMKGGCRVTDPECGASWIDWWIVPLDEVKAFFRLDEPDIIASCYGREPYGASYPGSAFIRPARVRIGRTRVLITQHGGYDV